ncbi:hypothetical protein EVAR_74748_1 [Eumeta japonica]|uniref:Uncharacterized protein n=1 Tax=Eumeta variegata TaxID=151549 RepID=A0A4C1SPV7_EUMVA|nr:hypothetical protein EVAR_74748_1 [Eumeta japonica]
MIMSFERPITATGSGRPCGRAPTSRRRRAPSSPLPAHANERNYVSVTKWPAVFWRPPAKTITHAPRLNLNGPRSMDPSLTCEKNSAKRLS